jgi:hypothetical protein
MPTFLQVLFYESNHVRQVSDQVRPVVTVVGVTAQCWHGDSTVVTVVTVVTLLTMLTVLKVARVQCVPYNGDSTVVAGVTVTVVIGWQGWQGVTGVTVVTVVTYLAEFTNLMNISIWISLSREFKHKLNVFCTPEIRSARKLWSICIEIWKT